MKFKLSTLALAILPAVVITNAFAADVETPSYSNNSLIITYKQGASQAMQRSANRGAKTKRFNHILGGRLAKLTISSGDIHLVMKRLRKHPAIESVELDHTITLNEPAAAVDDPHFDILWGLKNTGQNILGVAGVAGADIDAEKAWEKTIGSRDVVVGVIDTGFDYTHEDLVANAWTNLAELNGQPGVDDDNNGYVDDIHGWDALGNDGDPMDTQGHGTHVSGTIGATGNNGVGVVGVNHEVSIVGCRFLGNGGGSTSGAIDCLNYMLNLKESGVNIKVTNNSWGGAGYSDALKAAIQANNDAGILFVAAAGNGAYNNDNSPSYPASYEVDNVIAVASTTNEDKMSGFSQYGLTSVDMGAPGSFIVSTYPKGLGGNPTGYAYLSGTSMASPQVAGAAALIASLDPNVSVADMKDILMNSGDPISDLAGKTVSGKRLNIANAVELVDPVWGYQLGSDVSGMQIVAGSAAAFSLQTEASLDWAGTISFGATSELTTSFDPMAITAGESTMVNVATTAETAFGIYNILVEGDTGEQLDNEGNPISDRSINLVVDVLPQGMQEFTFSKNESILIPDGDANGIQSIITLADNITTINTTVRINIPAGDSSDFKIVLTSPAGTSKVVHNRTSTAGDGLVAEIDLARAFYGEMVAGDWTLNVADEVRLDRGTFAGWSMTFDGVGELLPAAPDTEFSYTASELTISFTDQSTDNNDDIVSWAWNFGDGSTSTEQNPVHTFASDNGYEVSLTVTDSRDVSTSKTKTVWAASQSLDLDIPRQYLSRRGTMRNKLVWSGSDAETVTITRNGVVVATDVLNTGKYTDSARRVTETSFAYQVCDSNDICSTQVYADF